MKFLISAGLLSVCIVFGGGGVPSPIAELVVQFAALLAMTGWILAVPPDSGRRLDRVLLGAVALFAAVPLLQLVPLPPAIWHALPGRTIELDALRLIGQENSWRPISIAPYRTLSAVLALIPSLALLFFVSRLSLEERTRLIGLAAALACVAAFVGTIQVAGGDAGWLNFYGSNNVGYALGFQANRNSTADVLIIGIIALTTFAIIRRDLMRDQLRKAAAGAVGLFLLLAVVLTGSRAGIAIAALVLAAMALFLFGRTLLRGQLRRHQLIAAGIGILIAVPLAVAALNSTALSKSWDRFANIEDVRPDLWRDTAFAIQTYWPVGSGVGTFVYAFLPAERLETVDRSAPNRAHNDYLEYTLETGLAGWVILIVLAALMAYRTVRIFRDDTAGLQQRHALFATAAVGVIGAHSMVDYPLRSMAIASLCALAVGMLAHPAVGEAASARRWSRLRLRPEPPRL